MLWIGKVETGKLPRHHHITPFIAVSQSYPRSFVTYDGIPFIGSLIDQRGDKKTNFITSWIDPSYHCFARRES